MREDNTRYVPNAENQVRLWFPSSRWQESAKTTTQPAKEGLHWDCESSKLLTAWGQSLWGFLAQGYTKILATKWCSHNWKPNRLSRLSYLGWPRLPEPTKYTMARSAWFLLALCFWIRSSTTWYCGAWEETKTLQPSANPLMLKKCHTPHNETTCSRRHTQPQNPAAYFLLTHTCQIFQARISLYFIATGTHCYSRFSAMPMPWSQFRSSLRHVVLRCLPQQLIDHPLRLIHWGRHGRAMDVAGLQLQLPSQKNAAGFLRRYFGHGEIWNGYKWNDSADLPRLCCAKLHSF